MIISKMWTAVLPVKYSLNSTFSLINDPKRETPLYQWLKSNLDNSYKSFLQNNHILIPFIFLQLKCLFYGQSYFSVSIIHVQLCKHSWYNKQPHERRLVELT